MRYDNPDLQDRLASAYVTGTLPILVRQRFEVLMKTRPALRARVAEWQEDLVSLDDEAASVEPPARVLRRLKERLNLTEPRPAWAFWSWPTFRQPAVIVAASLAIILASTIGFLAFRPAETVVQLVGQPKYVAVLQTETGTPAVVVTGYNKPFRLAVEPLGDLPSSEAGTLRLWAVERETGTVRPLLSLRRRTAFEEPLSDEGWQHIKTAESLILSLEPADATPATRSGPVLYSGPCLNLKGPPNT